MSRLLSKIKAPNDVKKLAANELPELCDEIREEIISTVADNGGHLASNLGVVELTVGSPCRRIASCGTWGTNPTRTSF